MPKIWFRVGMEAEVSKEEMQILQKNSFNPDNSEAGKLMLEVINRNRVCGETYIPCDNGMMSSYSNPNEDVDFYFET